MKRLLIVGLGLLLCSGCYNASDRIQWIKENSESTPTIYMMDDDEFFVTYENKRAGFFTFYWNSDEPCIQECPTINIEE